MKWQPLYFIVLAGCSLAPPYSPPENCPPVEWKEKAVQGIPLPSCAPWWTLFNDEELNHYEELALSQNQTLQIAYQRIMESRGIALSASSGLYPQAFVNFNTFNSGTVLNGPTGGFVRAHIQDYTLPIDASYEVDLFGKIRNTSYAAWTHVQAVQFDYTSIALTLTTDVALNYFACKALDAQIVVLDDTIRSRKDEVEVTQARFDAGLVNYSDVSRALNQLATAYGDLEIAEQARRAQENALAVLLGYYASEFTIPPSPLQTLSSTVSPDTPWTLLQKRPDVASAERTLAEQNALIGVAKAGYFPSLTLNGTLGYSSLDWDRLLNWQSRLWAWGIQASQLLFDGYRVQGEVEAQTARFMQALGQYTQTTLVAYQEAEDALSAQKHSRAKFEYDEEAVEAAEDTRSISNERYLKGLVTYLDVVDAERTLLANRLERERTRFQTYQSTIQLIKAIGGGFELE